MSPHAITSPNAPAEPDFADSAPTDFVIRRRAGRAHAVVTATLAAGALLAGLTPASAAYATTTKRTAARPHTRSEMRADAGSSRPWQQPLGVFGPSSVWQQNISGAPLAENSAAMVDNLGAQVAAHYNGNTGFNAYQYNASWYTASSTVPTTTLGFNDCRGNNKTPKGLFGPGGQFVDVPIPAGAVPSAGTDAEMSIYQPSTNTLWDFWKVTRNEGGYQACWGGRIEHTSRNRGFFANGFGATATGLAAEAGDVSIADIRSGVINHAVALQIPTPATFKRVSWPAQRSDGSQKVSDQNAIPEGTRLRLDSRINVSSLNLSPIAAMIAKAAQKYGFIVTDRSGCVSVATESGTPTQNATGTNPWDEILRGTKPFKVMKNFPWRNLQALPQNYGK